MKQNSEVSLAPVRTAAGAQVDESAALGPGTAVWELAQIREQAVLGDDCVVGRGAYVGPGVRIGDGVKIQNLALVYEPAELGNGVFIGPAVVLTNDHNPRSVDPEGRPKGRGDWEPVGVTVAEGASLGARSVCVAPVRVGRWAMVAAGCRGHAGRAGLRARRRMSRPVASAGWAARDSGSVSSPARPACGSARTPACCTPKRTAYSQRPDAKSRRPLSAAAGHAPPIQTVAARRSGLSWISSMRAPMRK